MSYDDGGSADRADAGFQMTRRVVVTGAAGLVGRRVVRKLTERGDHVLAITRPGSASQIAAGIQVAEIDLASASVTSFADLGRYDAVMHLAQAPGWHDFPRNAGSIAAVSLTATACLAEAAVAAGAKTFVLASSGGIYGPSAAPIREDAPIKPAAELGFYLATKAAAEQLMHYFAGHLTTHVLRPFFIYGPGQADTFLIPRLIRSVRNGTPVRLDSGIGPRLNPIFVDDAADAFVAALDISTPLTVNLAGPETVTLKRIVSSIAAHLQIEPLYETIERQPGDFIADTERMTARLGRATTTMDDGLKRAASTTFAPEPA